MSGADRSFLDSILIPHDFNRWRYNEHRYMIVVLEYLTGVDR
jgi:hypothetical protein